MAAAGWDFFAGEGANLGLQARYDGSALGEKLGTVHGGSLHVILLTSLLGRRMPDVFGFLPQEQDQTAPEWWVQSWDSGYRELSIGDIATQSELDELAADAAHQLAGHFWATFPEPLRQYLRFAQLRAFDLVESRARLLARELAAETVAGWERFRSGS